MMNHSEIIKYLPHRYPFLLVDRVLSIVPGESLTAIKNVTTNEPYFVGHFPKLQVMPGVLMIEAMAQASGIFIYKSRGIIPTENELFYLAGIDSVRFKRLVVPGDQLHLEVKMLKEKLNLWKFEGTASVEGELACRAVFMNIKAPDVE